jgi:hypothetical protein
MTPTDPGEQDQRGLSRRSVLGAAGIAVAGGVAAATGLASPAVAAPAATDVAADTNGIAIGLSGSTVVEFRGRIKQTGSRGDVFTAFGYLTRVVGLDSAALFSGSATNESTALFTLFATGQLQSRVLDTSVHALDIVGTLDVYQRSTPGATFSDPSSFTVGTKAAAFTMQLQDVLAVFAPNQGIPTLTGDMEQTSESAPSGRGQGKRFGKRGNRSRLFATGLGTLVDPVTLNAALEVAGNWAAD